MKNTRPSIALIVAVAAVAGAGSFQLLRASPQAPSSAPAPDALLPTRATSSSEVVTLVQHAPPPPSPPPSPEEVQARGRERIALIRKVMNDEPRDAAWADAREEAARTLMRREFLGRTLTGIACRTTLCSFDVRLKTRGEFEEWRSRMVAVLGAAGLPRASMMPTFNDDGSVTVAAFFAKDGSTIPGGPWKR